MAVAITLGDPTGIGPEVALAAASGFARSARRAGVTARPRLVLVGDLGAAADAAVRLGAAVELVRCDPKGLARLLAELPRAGRRLALPVVAPPAVAELRASERKPGRPNVAAARVAYASIGTAVVLARSGAVEAICTAPISKEWFDRARVASTGHTEILAELTGASGVRLMMVLGRLRVVLATTHIALRDVPGALTVDGIAETIAVTARHLRRWWRIGRPRIAVAALNPHASDGGIYGDEEERLIAPAIARARRSRVDAIGPIPADTIFSALGPPCDAVVAMYHDQGLIPVKQADVHRAVNVTLGLPFVRTSPDHGTAFDLAGRGRANARSMESALALAVGLATSRRRLPRVVRGGLRT
jgi:4-hydroxythreonine-4-phosphate dehydrogenase